MNILLTSVGRRGYLVDYFKKSLPANGKVITTNSDPLTSGMVLADKSYVVPNINAPEYIPTILDICKVENISLVVSLFDIDLPFLAKANEDFKKIGVKLIVSNLSTIEMVNDKWKTYKFLVENKINTPKTFLNLSDVLYELEASNLSFPLIIKPRWGMGSISIFKAESIEELKFFFKYVGKEIRKTYLNILNPSELEDSVLIQEYISGKEYGADVFNNLEGDNLQIIIKEKISMRSGETDIAKIIKEKNLEKILLNISKIIRHIGNMDIDILESNNGDFYILEMNARFGGGYPFSHLAGVNYPAALIAMAEGKTPKISDYREGCIGMKNIEIMEYVEKI